MLEAYPFHDVAGQVQDVDLIQVTVTKADEVLVA
jgi:hypothetical protein